MKVIIRTVVFVSILCCGCNKKSQEYSSGIVIEDTITQTKINASTFFSEIEYVFLENSLVALISQVNDIKFSGKKLYIFDRRSSKVLVFNSIGHHLFDVGEKGYQEGQYLDITNFTISNSGDIAILDNQRKRLIMYSSENTYLGEFFIGHSPLAIHYTIDNSIITYNSQQSIELSNHYYFIVYNEKGEVINRIHKGKGLNVKDIAPVRYYNFANIDGTDTFISLDMKRIINFIGTKEFSYTNISLSCKKKLNNETPHRFLRVIESADYVFFDCLINKQLSNYVWNKKNLSVQGLNRHKQIGIHLWGFIDDIEHLVPVWPEYNAANKMLAQSVSGAKLRQYCIKNQDSIKPAIYNKIINYTNNPLCNPVILLMKVKNENH